MNCSAVSHKKPQLDLSLQIPASCPWCAWDRADAPLSALIITRQGLLFFNKRDNWLSLSGWLCLVSGNGNGSDQMPRSRSQSSLIREGPANLRTTPLQKQGKGQLTAEWSPLCPSVRRRWKDDEGGLSSQAHMEILMGKASQCLSFKKHSFFSPILLHWRQYLPGNAMRQLRGQQTGGLPVRWCTCKWDFSMHGSMCFFLSFKQCSHQTATPREYIYGKISFHTPLWCSPYKNVTYSSTMFRIAY